MRWFKFLAVMIVFYSICFFLLFAISQQVLGGRIITIPIKQELHRLTPEDRVLLEEMVGDLDTAYREGIVVPGQHLDTDNPGIAFVLSFNRFIAKRQEILNKFGPEGFHDISDYSEVVRFETMRESWEAYEREFEGVIEEFRTSQKEFRRLEKAWEAEKRQ